MIAIMTGKFYQSIRIFVLKPYKEFSYFLENDQVNWVNIPFPKSNLMTPYKNLE